MKFRTGILFVVVCFWCSGIADGNPYVTNWWSRGVATVKNFVFGFPPTPWHQEAAWRIEFDPDAGLRKAPDYQQHFGPRGERLIEFLGSGAYRPAGNVTCRPSKCTCRIGISASNWGVMHRRSHAI